MAWSGLTLTVDGRNALNQAQLANEINFKSIVVGDGDVPNNFSTQKALVHQLFEITDIKIDVTDSGCSITADFPTAVDDYYFREVGVIVSTADGDKLYVYDNCGDDAQLIVVSTGVESTKKRIRLSLAISGVAEINVTEPGILYVSYEDFELEMKNKVDKVEGKGLSANDFTDEEKDKLDGIEAGANNYAHPETHPATMIVQDSNHRMVTDLKIAAWDETYQQATAYVDSAIADLINGAPETLDTLKEIADAMAENESVVDALNQAIGTKASQAELDTHTGNGTIHITASERTKWNQTVQDVSQLNTDLVYKRVVLDEPAIKVLEYNAYILRIKSIRAWKAMSGGTQYIFSDDLTKYGIGFSSPIRKIINIAGGRTAALHMENNILYITFSDSVTEGENIYIDETFSIS